MNNAHSLAVSNAGASPVTASATGCKNCHEAAASDEAPSFAELLEAETDEGPAVSDPQQMEPGQTALPADLSSLSADNLSAAALLAQAANDSVSSDGEDATDLQDNTKGEAEPLIANLTTTPAELDGQNGQSSEFANHLQAIIGQIDPDGVNEAGNQAAGPHTALTGPPLTGTPLTGTPLTQDNAQPLHQNQTNGLPAASPEARLQAGSPQGQDLKNQQAAAENLLNGTGLSPKTNPAVTSDMAATSDMAQGQGPGQATEQGASQALNSDSAKAARLYGQEAAGMSTRTSQGETQGSQAATRTGPAGASAPATSDSEATGSKEADARPDSLMQRLKPLAQAAFSLQSMEMDKGAKTPDGLTSALSMTVGGDLARPAGMTGLTPTTNNSGLPQVPLNNIAVHIASQASAGNMRFNIRLDPPELGRIDIRLEIGRDGQTMTHLSVEKPETLDLLRQDARQLERALSNAGLDSRNGSLSFSLRDENQNRQQAGSSNQDATPGSDETIIEPDEGMAPPVTRTVNMNAGLDISI